MTYDTWVTCGTEIVKYYQGREDTPTFLAGLSAGGMLAYQVACESRNMKAIANHKELVEILIKDEKSSGVRVPVNFIYTMLNPQIKTEPEQFTQCPVLLAHPGDDRWTGIELSNLFYNRLACEKRTVILEGAGHSPIDGYIIYRRVNYP